jgi:hypothetical protein
MSLNTPKNPNVKQDKVEEKQTNLPEPKPAVFKPEIPEAAKVASTWNLIPLEGELIEATHPMVAKPFVGTPKEFSEMLK